MQPNSLQEKVALVTGASGLLGREHALALASAGAKTIMTDIDEIALDNARCQILDKYPDANVEAYYMDVTSRVSVNEVVAELDAQRTVVTALVNNAAINPKNDNGDTNQGLNEASRLEKFDSNKFQMELNVGLSGAILCSSVFGERMAANNGGVIINIASDLSIISPYQRLYEQPSIDPELQPVKPVNYSVIKAGLHGLTLYLSTYWAHKNVRANTLSPGGVFNEHDPEFVSRLERLIPLGRMARLDEYHEILIFLAGEGASYLNGQNIVMDGGRSAW